MITSKLKRMIVACCLLTTAYFSYATVKLPTVLGNNMVLQQNEKVCLWGSAKPSAEVTIKTSWNNKKYRTQADKHGKWEVYVETTQAGGPYNITFDDGEKVTLNNILLGDVWICSGQSNMEMPLKGLLGQPVKESLKFITEAQKYSEIRMYTGKQTASLTEEFDNQGSWEQASIQHAPQFSAVGYFYAKTLYDVLKTPIGMIHISWGGASIESWMSEETLKLYPNIKLKDRKLNTPHPQQVPTLLYNGMLHPISNYTIKGFIWYQGETNIGNYKEYTSLFQDMVKEWRNLFKMGEKLPFYYVQIAPFQYDNPENIGCALLRESQLKCSSLIPNSGMAITMDKGELTCIHPSEKEIVGQRLAYQALRKTYNFKQLPCDGPTFDSMKLQDKKLIVTFNNAEMGLYPMFVELPGFEVAGNDGKFYPAKAMINQFGNFVEVWSNQVEHPVHWRYAFKNYIKGSLYNGSGLPASSFRTDTL